jgi:hypothetical protein
LDCGNIHVGKRRLENELPNTAYIFEDDSADMSDPKYEYIHNLDFDRI